jgi:hypothetical protein
VAGDVRATIESVPLIRKTREWVPCRSIFDLKRRGVDVGRRIEK